MDAVLRFLLGLAGFLAELLQAIAEADTNRQPCRRCRRHVHQDGESCAGLLMRLVLEHGPEDLITHAASVEVAKVWGFSHSYPQSAARVVVWNPELAARVAAGGYSLNRAAEEERNHRLGPWHVR